MAKTNDLTQGTIWKKIVLLAIPLLLGSLIQQLYNTVDLIFVGNYIDKSASAAIGASSLLIVCLVGFFGGLSVGSGVVVSHMFGAKDHQTLSKAVHNAIAMSIAAGLLFMVAGYFFAPLYLRLVNTPTELQTAAVGYLRIYFLSFVSMFVYNLGSGILRALGNTRIPLIAQLAGGIVNVALDAVFLRFFHNGIYGVAWATFFSQTVAAAITLYHLSRLDSVYAFRFRKIAFDGKILKEVIRIGVPAGMQSFLITLANVMAQYHINSFGEDAIAAFTAYFKVELIIYLPIVAFGQAIMTFSGQNTGAKEYGRVRKGTRICLFISMGTAVCCSILALCFGKELFRVFNKEQDVIRIGCQLIAVSFPFYFIYCILQILGDSLRGAGRTRGPMLVVMINICVFRTLLLFLIVPRVQSIRGVIITYPITWILTSLCMIVIYMRYQNQSLRS